MRGINKKLIRTLSLVLGLSLLLGLNGQHAEAALRVGANNTSDKMYKWTEIKDYESLWNVVEKTNEPYRLLLLCGGVESRSKGPRIEQYATFDRSKQNHSFHYVPIEEANQISYNEEYFYTRGDMNTPFIEFTGETFSDSVAGDDAPRCKIFMPDENGEQSDVMLCSVEGWFADAQSKLWTAEQYKNDDEWTDKTDDWVFFFPVQSFPSGYASMGEGYKKAVKGYIGLGSDVDGDDLEFEMIDWELDDGTTKYLTRAYKTLLMGYEDSNESMFKCYIGKEVEVQTTGSITVHDGQNVSFTDMTLIEPDSVIRVEKGGTLFISGTCYHNGLIINEGGTIILQKGAVMRQSDPPNSSSGMIQLNGGDFIVREGACLMLTDKRVGGRCDITLNKDAYFLNSGIVALANDIKLTSKNAVLEISKNGVLNCGYQMVPGEDIGYGYQASKTDVQIDDYLASVREERLQKTKKTGQGYLYNDGGTIINEGNLSATTN